ncbi:low temperature requirement protein LtrA [Neorhizobium galegae]|uniref:low temperature requirement protein A n=1 Tax=Neorhizobium galegae TaxID=399 RepID=UPI001AE7F7F3|nr:low temperature requirement protein A [Neorhizobium galegae]MBP2549338.1 low temperature requirement protein LtrA [Neorhizobium galegae]
MGEGEDDAGELLREERQEDKRVGFPELFFDLIFVFSLIQLSHFIVTDFTPLGLLQGGMIALALWWLWNHTAWVMNWLDPEHGAVRAMLFGLMFFGLLLSAAIPHAFDEAGLMFAGAYIAMQLGRSLFAIYAFKEVNPAVRRNFGRVSVWFALSGCLWLAGALSEEETRVILWLLALGVDYAAPELRFYVPGFGYSRTRDWDISGEHMAERCALFVLICLGESVLAIGRTFAEEEIGVLLMASFCGAFAATVLMWWIYFHFGQARASHEIETTDEPGEVALHVFTYGHMPVVAGIILTAVAAEHLLSHAPEAGDAQRSAVILGGPLLFLLGNLWVKRMTTGRLPASHVAGIGLSILLFSLAPFVSTHVTGLAAVALLLVVAVWEYRKLARRGIEPQAIDGQSSE